MDLPFTVFETDLFRPEYRPLRGERWELRHSPMNLAKGYWSDPLLILNLAALVRFDGPEPRTWMSMTPMEIESQEIGVRFAAGHTVVMGLGMGWAAANAALNPAVTRVTVVEFDPEVIRVISAMNVFGQLPPEAEAKVTVHQGDATTFVPDRPADTLMADIWLPLYGDGRLDQVRQMRTNTGARRVYYWGQEMDIAERARDRGEDLSSETIAEIVSEMGLPLIGPAEVQNYPDLVARAARNWLRPI